MRVRSAAIARIWCSSSRVRSACIAVMRSVSRCTRSNSSFCSGVKRGSRCCNRSARSRCSASALACSSRRPCACSLSFSWRRPWRSAFCCKSSCRCWRKASLLWHATSSGFKRSNLARAPASARSACVVAKCACARSFSRVWSCFAMAFVAAPISSLSPLMRASAASASSCCRAMPCNRKRKNSRCMSRRPASKRLYSSASCF
mmetsp:Transcript_81832/g.227953  ORF Transcript_81832/g.227953 Transcript_81832/m.227953 type:complete len:203 (+) Transcript_81832:2577-3185(+)